MINGFRGLGFKPVMAGATTNTGGNWWARLTAQRLSPFMQDIVPTSVTAVLFAASFTFLLGYYGSNIIGTILASVGAIRGHNPSQADEDDLDSAVCCFCGAGVSNGRWRRPISLRIVLVGDRKKSSVSC